MFSPPFLLILHSHSVHLSAQLLFSGNDKLSLCLSQPFMSPRFPGGPRPSLRMPNQVWTTHLPIQLNMYFQVGMCWWSILTIAPSLAHLFPSASRGNPWFSASPAKQHGPHQTTRCVCVCVHYSCLCLCKLAVFQVAFLSENAGAPRTSQIQGSSGWKIG